MESKGKFFSSDVFSVQFLIYRIFNPIAIRKAKIAYNFGLSERNRVKTYIVRSDQFLF